MRVFDAPPHGAGPDGRLGADRPGWGRREPAWVDRILDWRWTWLAARVALTLPYTVGAVMKLRDFRGAVREQEQLGLRPGKPFAVATIATELLAPIAIVSGRFVWLGAGALGVFTGLANLLVNRFWEKTDPEERFRTENGFYEHIALIAGFACAALVAEHAIRERGRARRPNPHR